MDLKPAGLIAAGDALAAGEPRVGGKAVGLARLVRAGATVPPWFVVPAEHFTTHLARTGAASLIAGEMVHIAAFDPGDPAAADTLADAATRIRRAVTALAVDETLLNALAAALETLGPGPFAVRSSLAGEDAATHSFAGQLDSFLFQPGVAEVGRCLVDCWASPFSARALAYGRRVGVAGEAFRMGVVVQQMIDGRVSGVLFTANPVTGRRDECLLTATWGQGQGIVSGSGDGDEFAWSHEGDELSARVAPKPIRVVRAPDGPGTATAEVPPADRDRRCLSADEVAAVCREGLRDRSLLVPYRHLLAPAGGSGSVADRHARELAHPDRQRLPGNDGHGASAAVGRGERRR
ncbi:MAG: hypothetical protein GY856_12880, partial [bacterium]|nr:hypothetical protein [bacterium]